MTKCVMCDQEIPGDRQGKDTCSENCAFEKAAAWNWYVANEKEFIMRCAISAWRKEKSVCKDKVETVKSR